MMWLIVVVLSRSMLLLSSFFLNGVWLVRAEGVRIGLCFAIGKSFFLPILDFGGYARAVVQTELFVRLRG
jgi:hypothetical protein